MRYPCVHALLTLLLVTAGCLATPGAKPAAPPGGTEPSASPTTVGERVSFPDGPKERPERPPELNRTSVREYVHAMESRLVYNSLWRGPDSSVTTSCEVARVDDAGDGYAATVVCGGYANVVSSPNGTPEAHYDYGEQAYRYTVTADATRRQFDGER